MFNRGLEECDALANFQVLPSRETWRLDDRSATCLHSSDGQFTPATGECYLVTAEDLLLSSSRTSCDGPHVFEAYHVTEHPNGAFPGQATIDTFGEETCLAAFEKYVGRAFEVSEVFFFYVTPSPATWDLLSDREAECYLGMGT